MSLDVSLRNAPESLGANATEEARRQIGNCNACLYKALCSVFPAINRQYVFAAGDITQLTDLYHKCRGCNCACHDPTLHDFAVNLPRALAEARAASRDLFARPPGVVPGVQRDGGALIGDVVLTWR